MDQNNSKVLCPDCQTEIKTEILAVGDILECQKCGTEVEVTQVQPLMYRLLIEEK